MADPALLVQPLPGRPWRRVARRAAWALGGLLVLYGVAQLLLSRASVEAALRDRIATALRVRVAAVELGDEVQIDPLFRVTFGPVVVHGLRPADPPLVRVERVKVRPDLWALLRTGRAVPASVRLYGVAVDLPGRPGALAQAWERLRPPRRPTPAPHALERAEPEEGELAPLHVRDLQVTATVGGRRVTFGPLQLTVRRARAAGADETDVSLALPGGGSGAGTLRRGQDGWHGELALSRVGPEAVPEPLHTLPVTWSGGELSVRLAGDAALDLARADGSLRLDASRVFLRGEGLAPSPVGPLDAALSGRLAWDGSERRAALTGGRLELLGTIPVTLEAELRVGPGLPFTASARADAVDFDAAVKSLPPALALPAAAPRPAGTLDARVTFSGGLLAASGWQVDADLDLSRMREAARQAPPVALRAPFRHRVLTERAEAEPAPELLVGPENPRFVPVAELPTHVVRAVTASEDAGFFAHSGFDFEELRNAAVQGAEKGRVVRGGSTISQQVAKNLFLSPEKTLARKLREAFLTVALEATLPKQRILEIYLNVAEWGPGVWGIGPAAQHWFGKNARALSPREAAFLATVIPNPVRYHYLWSRGAPTEAWDARVNGLLAKMYTQGTLSDEALWEAEAEPLSFARGAASGVAPPAGADEGEDAPPLPGPRGRPRAAHRSSRPAR